MRSLFRRVSASMTSREFKGPEGKRLYAIGDIHGRLDLLDNILGLISQDLGDYPIETAAIVFLGDLIDRGPDSAGVIERAMGLDMLPGRAFCLLGNHEEILLRVLDGEPTLAYDWLGFGGDACVESYGVSSTSLTAMDEERIAQVLNRAIPPSHIRYLRGCGDTFSFGDFLLVHAGIRPGVPIDQQTPHDLRWIRQPFLSDAHDHGVMVVHGHTISDGVERRPNRIGIDTGAYRTGILTAAVIQDGDTRFLATGS